jgi:hypothetical protein
VQRFGALVKGIKLQSGVTEHRVTSINMLGSKSDNVGEVFRTLHNKELRDLYRSPSINAVEKYRLLGWNSVSHICSTKLINSTDIILYKGKGKGKGEGKVVPVL